MSTPLPPPPSPLPPPPPIPTSEPATSSPIGDHPVKARARSVLDEITPAVAGVGAYAIVGLVFGAVPAVLVVLVALAVIEASIHHREARRMRRAARTGRNGVSKGVVELVIGAVILRRDGVIGSVLAAVTALLVGLLVLTLSLGLVLLGLGVVVSAAHGIALFVGVVAAAGLEIFRLTEKDPPLHRGWR